MTRQPPPWRNTPAPPKELFVPTTAVPRLIEFLLRRRMALLVVAVVLTLLAIGPARRLSFDQSIESLYSNENPRLHDYTESKALFQGDELVFVAYTDPELFTDAGLERTQRLAEKIAAVPGVAPQSVQSLAAALGGLRYPFMAPRRERVLEFCRGILLGDDRQTTAVVARLEDERTATVPRSETIAAIRRVAANQAAPAHVVGEPVLVHDMFRYAEEDGEWMGWAASGLLMVVILFFLRSMRWLVLPIVVVQMTLAWTLALVVLSGMRLSMVSSILTSLVTIIGVSTIVYIALYYRKLRERLDREPALRETLHVLGLDVFWVCVTTAGGFATQLASHIHPVQSFGVMMIIGSLLVLAAMMLVLPGGVLLGREPVVATSARTERRVNRLLQSLTESVLRHPYPLSVACLLVSVWALAGLARLRIETDFTKNFRSDSPVVQALDFVESRLGGAGAWEVNFPAPDKLTPEYLERVRRLTEQLRDLRFAGVNPLTKVLAASDGIDLIPRVPFISPGLAGQLRVLHGMQPEFLPSLYNPAAGRMRILLRSSERQPSEQKQWLIARVEELARREFPEAKTTGLYVLLTFLIDSLMHDQWTNLVLGGAGLVALMTLSYRNLWFGIMALIPNVLPILILLGGMGWAGLPVNIGTAMISSDTMGLTVHDSIFYISAYLRARRSGVDFLGALRETQTEVGKPLIYSNIALILGFLVLTSSHFIPLVYFGLLVSVAILGGLIGNLVLLPLLLRLSDGKEATP